MESILKQYFPVIIKPIFLTLLLFIAVSLGFVIFQVISPISPEQTIIDPKFTPEVREMLRELFALDKPLSTQYMKYVQNMFTWNFGYSFMSFRPVVEEMVQRLPCTLLLIVLSTVFSVLIGVGLSALMGVLLKRSRRRPSTFAHSLRGLFLGPIPFIALLFLLFFCYYLYTAFDSRVFPAHGLYSIPPPTHPLVYIVDVAWHLALPVTILVLVNGVKGLLIIWSSGSPFTSDTELKRFLLPVTTTDFTFTISAVIIIEWIFTLPGVGRWFLNSLLAADFPVIMASSVVFVEIAVALGFASVFFDFLQRFVGLRDDLDRKIVTHSETSVSPTGVYKSFVKRVLRRKSVVIGSAIVLAFLVLAIFAPFITPYDPIARERVAEDFSMPAWVTIFPQYKDYPATKEFPLYWNAEEEFDFVKAWGRKVLVQYEAEGMETVDVKLNANFSYLSIPPNDFYLKFAWKSEEVQDTSYSLKLTLSTPEDKDYELWDQPPLSASRHENVLIESANPFFRERLGFEMHENPAPVIFSKKGEYTLLIRMKLKPTSENAKCEITFEGAELTIPGQVHGILGTDSTGSDVFCQLVYGARTMVIYAFLTASLAILLGFPFGFLSGYFQGWVDNILISLTDTLLCLPVLPIFLVVHLFAFPFEPAARGTVFPLVSLIFLSPLAAEAFRNMFLVRPSNQKFKGKIGVEQVLNTFKDLLLNLCLLAMSLVLLLPTIEFLGFGDPSAVSWGKMLHHAFGFGAFPRLAWWWLVPPIICIALFALGLLLLGAGLEDA